MVKSFDENERDLIRQKLLEKGRQLFESYGLKKTTVDVAPLAEQLDAQADHY